MNNNSKDMIKKILLITALAIMACPVVSAQDSTSVAKDTVSKVRLKDRDYLVPDVPQDPNRVLTISETYTYSIRFSVGFNFNQMFTESMVYGHFFPSMSSYAHEYEYLKNVFQNPDFMPSFNLDFAWRFATRWELGIRASYYAFTQKGSRADQPSKTLVNQTHSIVLAPYIKFNYIVRPLWSLYSEIGLGIQINASKFPNEYATQEIRKTEAWLAVQGTIVGVTVGKQIYGTFELGLGQKGLLNVGVGYRF